MWGKIDQGANAVTFVGRMGSVGKMVDNCTTPIAGLALKQGTEKRAEGIENSKGTSVSIAGSVPNTPAN